MPGDSSDVRHSSGYKDAIIKRNPPSTAGDAVRKAVTFTELDKGNVDLKGAYEAAKKHNLNTSFMNRM